MYYYKLTAIQIQSCNPDSDSYYFALH